MRTYQFSELASYMAKEIHGTKTAQDQLLFSSVSSDTRSLTEGSLFVALVGERFDAHAYLAEAADAGAVAFILSEETAVAALPEAQQRPYMLVEDTEDALDQIARWYRHKIAGEVIGITGSVGKTSTRQMVMAALNRSLKVTATKANLNNHIGLASTILATDEQTGALIVEMGIDRPGDMLRLTRMAEPDIAIVTGIGVSHIAQFKTREAICAAKLEITKGLRDGAWLLLNGDNDLLSSYAHDQMLKKADNDDANRYQIAFISAAVAGEPDLPGRCLFARNVRSDFLGSSFDCWEKYPGEPARLWISHVELPVPGRHQIQNSLLGLLAADILGVRAEAAKEGLMDFEASGDRQRLMDARGVTIINDSYNASPESMKAALELLDTLGGERRKLVALGGMNELGEMEEKLHFNLGLDVARSEVDYAWLCGPLAAHVKKGIHALKPDCPVEVFPDREALAASLIPQLEDNDILLIKASRSFAMEKLAEEIARQRLTADLSGNSED